MTSKRMNISDLHPQVQKQIARMPTIALRNPLSRLLMKMMMEVMYRPQNHASVRMRAVDLGPFGVRVYEPHGARSGAGMLFIHGGGYVLGKAKMNDRDCNDWARELGLTVVSVDYRLAPKHPFPTPLDDCFLAWTWFLENAAALGVNSSRIVVAGQSAGGGLAAGLCQRILDDGGSQPAAQLLFYPMIDDRTATDESLTRVRHLVWNNENNLYGWSAYLGHPVDGPTERLPWSVPSRRVDLSNLPPAWIGVGDKDLFYGENLAYAARLSESGVPNELEIVESAPHGFDALAPDAEISRAFRSTSLDFMRRHLGIDG